MKRVPLFETERIFAPSDGKISFKAVNEMLPIGAYELISGPRTWRKVPKKTFHSSLVKFFSNDLGSPFLTTCNNITLTFTNVSNNRKSFFFFDEITHGSFKRSRQLHERSNGGNHAIGFNFVDACWGDAGNLGKFLDGIPVAFSLGTNFFTDLNFKEFNVFLLICTRRLLSQLDRR